MKLLVMRDLIKENYGNYYVVQEIDGHKITLVNAIIHHTFRRILNESFVKEAYKGYDKPVAVGKYFLDALKSR